MQELNEADSQLIINHINGTLTDAEQLLFEQQYQKDPAFRAEIAAYEDAKLAAFIGGQSRIKHILKEEAEKYKAEKEEKENKEEQDTIKPVLKIAHLRTWILRGVAATFVIGIAGGIFRYTQTQKMENLYAANFKPLDNAIFTQFRGYDSIKIDTAFRLRHDSTTIKAAYKAFDFYSNKQYTQSVDGFNQIKTTDDTLALYKANALLAINNTDEALTILTRLATSGKGYTQAFAEWFLALAYLKQQNRAESRALLQKITTTSAHPFYAEATQLMQALN